MAAELDTLADREYTRQFHVSLPPEIHRVLEAQFQVYGKDEEEVILEVLREWARLKRREAEFIVEYLRSDEAEGAIKKR